MITFLILAVQVVGARQTPPPRGSSFGRAQRFAVERFRERGRPLFCSVIGTDINRTPVSKTRPLSPYQLTHDTVMQAWASDIHAAARQEPTGGPVFILYSTQSSLYIHRYTVLIRGYYYISMIYHTSIY